MTFFNISCLPLLNFQAVWHGLLWLGRWDDWKVTLNVKICYFFVFIPEIYPAKQPHHLLSGYLLRLSSRLRPGKFPFLEALVPYAKSVAVIIQNFQPIAAARTEHKHIPFVGVFTHLVFHHSRKPVYVIPKICRSRPYKYPHIAKVSKHHRTSTSARTTSATNAGDMPSGISRLPCPERCRMRLRLCGTRQFVSKSSTKPALCAFLSFCFLRRH